MNNEPKPSSESTSQKLTRYWPVAAVTAFAAAFWTFNSVGCVPRAKSVMELPDEDAKGPSAVDELTLAFEALRALNNPAAIERNQMHQVVNNRSINNSRSYLNDWLRKQDVNETTWEVDPLFRNLPRALREHPAFQRLDYLEYTLPDLSFLQQSLWLNDIANRVAREPAPPNLAPWLAAMDKAGQIDAARQLRQAERLFDWTVRNIQLQPLLPPPKGPELTVEEAKKVDQRPPYERGVPGPGYQQLPYQTLQYGTGDAWERGRIFIQLCRHAALPAVMLGIVQENELGGPQAWTAAVLVNDEFYLFDPQLGLAIPGPDRQGIATLSQFIADEALRNALQPPGGPAYPITAENLKNVAVLMDVQPEVLTRRMQLLEAPLNNARGLSRTEPKPKDKDQDDRLPIVLTYRPSDWEKKLRKAKHISSVSLWRVPFEAILYQPAFVESLKTQPELAEKRMLREFSLNNEKQIYLGDTQTVDRSLVEGQKQRQRTPRSVTMIQGRDYYLRGRFDDLDTLPGARSVFLSFRPSSIDIELRESSVNYLRAIGDDGGLADDPAIREKQMKMSGLMMRSVKSSATYGLALSYYEERKYDDAIQWAERVLTSPDAGGEWQAGARYLAARSYEALGKLDQARELYLADDSPQATGNKLRAEWLADATDKKPAESPKAEK